MPESPALRACTASELTCSGNALETPVAASDSASMLVRTVIASVAGTGTLRSNAAASAPRCPAAIMAEPPTACMVSMSAPESTAEAAAPST